MSTRFTDISARLVHTVRAFSLTPASQCGGFRPLVIPETSEFSVTNSSHGLSPFVEAVVIISFSLILALLMVALGRMVKGQLESRRQRRRMTELRDHSIFQSRNLAQLQSNRYRNLATYNPDEHRTPEDSELVTVELADRSNSSTTTHHIAV